MLLEIGYNQPISKINKDTTLTEIFDSAQKHCKDCKIPSPTVCVERCDVWKVKNEILEIKQIMGRKGHLPKLLNAIKNSRLLKILEALTEYPRNVKDLQKKLKKIGFYHSCSTIMFAYLKPLIEAGLIKEDGARYRVTIYGKKIHSALKFPSYSGLLPVNSCCYEEVVLKELANKSLTFEELANNVPPRSLSRILLRLRHRGLLTKTRLDYVFYHRIKGKPKMKLSSTEKRVFNSIPLTGISAHQLTKEVRITLRRTYKYLRRLREKKIVFALKMHRTYELTINGKEIASVLDKMAKLTTDSLNLPISIKY
jgi:predicted transcriptional regulator